MQTVGYNDMMGGATGSFTLSFGGYTTSAISVGASAATVQTAMQALTSIGSGNISVTKTSNTSNSQIWTLTFIGSLGGANQAQLTINTSGISSMMGVSNVQTTTTNGQAAVDEIQTVAVSNATGGTFRLAYKGQTTAPLAYNASAATVDSALEALSTIGSSAVTVSLSGSVYTVTFGGGSLHNTNVDKLQGDVSTATYGTVDRTISTTYDAADQISQESDPSATIDYTRDNLGRATSIVNTISGRTICSGGMTLRRGNG